MGQIANGQKQLFWILGMDDFMVVHCCPIVAMARRRSFEAVGLYHLAMQFKNTTQKNQMPVKFEIWDSIPNAGACQLAFEMCDV